MNRRISSFVTAALFVFAASSVFGYAQSVEEQIKKLEMDRAAAVLKADMDTLDKQTADDYSLININGEMSDKKQMMDAIKSGGIKLTQDDISDMKVRVYGNTAVVTGKADVKGTMGGKDATGQAMFTRVYVKKGGKWQTVALQQTKMSTP
ncbi:MAG TPA: nuclear transport factor 2 family protein [Terriglobales bacterium]|nr:nuclear transport factor 2 family protein [Terriglobales bacterium]